MTISLRAWCCLLFALWLAALPASAVFNFTAPSGVVTITPTVAAGHRNRVYYVGDTPSFTLNKAATRYEVRDYYGNLVAQGNTTGSGLQITPTGTFGPGWYKLYVYGSTDQGAPYGFSVGATNFVVFRNNPNFPATPAVGTSGSPDASQDEIMRGVIGMGPQRLYINDATVTGANLTSAIATLTTEINIDQQYYLGRDPQRNRALLITFPNGISNSDGTTNITAVANATQIVSQIVAQYPGVVTYWECRNEPDNSQAAPFKGDVTKATAEYLAFYNAVKAGSTSAKVVGPAVNSIETLPGHDHAAWVNTFLTLVGTQIDAFSYHAYNLSNGDVALTRRCLNDLQTILAAHTQSSLPVWQTEQGFFGPYYGTYAPRHEAQWTMVQMMIQEQYGIPKEHNHLWYDVSHGNWSVPAFWENNDTSLNPAAALMRVWSEELYGTNFSRAYNFGTETNVFVGSLFVGPSRSVASFMTAGSPSSTVMLSVSGSSIHTVSPFGVEADLPVTNGIVLLPVSELPNYVELATGQTCEVVQRAYGINAARLSGASVQVNGASDTNAPKIINGSLQENWYYSQVGNIWAPTSSDSPWNIWAMNGTLQNGVVVTGSLPDTIDIVLPSAQTVSDVLVYSSMPWQFQSTLLNYNLQYWNGAAWTTIDTVVEPVPGLNFYTPYAACNTDQYFSNRCVFEHHFAPVTTTKLRVLVNDVTYGDGPNLDSYTNYEKDFPKAVYLREVEIYKAVAPVLIGGSQTQSVTAGGGVTLTAQASNPAGATYVWKQNGNVIGGVSGSTLSLSNFNLDSQAAYSVTVSNTIGAASQTSYLTLNTPFNTWAARYYTPDVIGQPRQLLTTVVPALGFTNLQLYFFGINPQQNSTSAADNVSLPVAALDGSGNLTLSFQMNPSATDVAWSVETAASPGGPWQPVTPSSTSTSAVNAAGRTPVVLTFPASSVQFLHLKLLVP